VNRRTLIVAVVPVLLAAGSWRALFTPEARWPAPVTWVGTAVLLAAMVTLPVALVRGHGWRRSDPAAVVGDTLLGALWALFSWSVIGEVARSGLLLAGVPDPLRARIVAVGVASVTAGLLAWGVSEARRVPRVRRVEVPLERLGPGLDGLRLAVLSDTHFGPLDRARWSSGVVRRVNALRPDAVLHLGDIADGTPEQRGAQAAPLADVHAPLGRYVVTGNHEYYGDAQAWVDHLTTLGWRPLRNSHELLARGGDRLVLAGVDDPTGARLPGHGPDLAAALAGTEEDLPVVLLAHQPRQVTEAVAAGVDLQLSGHTHGGQIWPFHLLIRTEQPAVSGLSARGPRSWLYISRGTGFWGPPFRVFAPSEITLLTLRRATG
jgi:hypothetical protein